MPYISSGHDQLSAVDDPDPENAIPVAFGLHQNTPNPFNSNTVIRFDLTEKSLVQLKVYDISGALVATLLDDQFPAGDHVAHWRGCDDSGKSMPSGVYFYRIASGKNLETRQMMLIK